MVRVAQAARGAETRARVSRQARLESGERKLTQAIAPSQFVIGWADPREASQATVDLRLGELCAKKKPAAGRGIPPESLLSSPASIVKTFT